MRRRRSLSVMIPATCALGLIVFLTGCGDINKSVHEYTTTVNNDVAELNARAGDLKSLWAVPVADQGEMQDVLAGFRKALDGARQTIDSVDPPEPCMELDGLLRRVVNTGRELAGIMSPFADYADRIAPLALRMNQVAETLENLQAENDVPSGVVALADKVEKINRDLGAVVPPSLFRGIHDEVLDYFAETSETFQSAARAARSGSRQPSVPEDDEESQPDAEPGPSGSGTAESLLRDVPREWESFNAKLATLMDVARDVSGVAGRNAELENLIGMTVAEIQRLEKQYR